MKLLKSSSILKDSPIAAFLCRFGIFFLVLSIPWPGLNKTYGLFFRTLAQTVFAEQSGERELSFEATSENAKHPYDTRVVIVNRALVHSDGSGPIRNLNIGFGWQSTAVLLALILASPIPWHRRGSAALLGLVCLHGFMLLSMYFFIWTESAEIGLTSFTPFRKHVADAVREIVVGQIGLAVPVAIWVLTTFRQNDQFKLLSPNALLARSEQPFPPHRKKLFKKEASE